MPDPLKALRPYYRVDERRSSLRKWCLACKRCRRAWHLSREVPIHTGNILYLMNHARSHEGKADA